MIDAVDVNEILDAAFSLGHRLRMRTWVEPGTFTQKYRLERIRGERLAEFAETALADDVICRTPEAVGETWLMLARRILGDELISDIGNAQSHLRDAAMHGATIELVGGDHDGQSLVVRSDPQGWPPAIWRMPRSRYPAMLDWTDSGEDAKATSFFETVDYAREVMNPDTGVWRYTPRGQ